jgi:hypothetical protein
MVKGSFVCAFACAVSCFLLSASVAVASPVEDMAKAHVHDHQAHAVKKTDAATGSVKKSADEAVAKADEKAKLADGLGIKGAAEAKKGVADAKAAVNAASAAAALTK